MSLTLLTLHPNVGTKSLPYMLPIKEKGFFKKYFYYAVYMYMVTLKILFKNVLVESLFLYVFE